MFALYVKSKVELLLKPWGIEFEKFSDFDMACVY